MQRLCFKRISSLTSLPTGYLIISSFANWKPTSTNSNPYLKEGDKRDAKNPLKLVTKIETKCDTLSVYTEYLFEQPTLDILIYRMNWDKL